MNETNKIEGAIILLGAPGSGKGTQAELLSKELNIPTISTGNMIRKQLKSGTELGKRLESYMSEGKLVPDEVIVEVVKERVQHDDCKNGFILDGFPRTIPQAEALDKMKVKVHKVIDIDLPDEAIIKRMSGRRVCLDCGATYHLETKKPKVEGVCDQCSSTLSQRKDDNQETVLARLEEYHKQTEPLKGYYTTKGNLSSVDGNQPLEKVFVCVLKVVR